MLVEQFTSLQQPRRTEFLVQAGVAVLAVLLGLQILWGVISLLLPAMPAAMPPAADAMRVAGINVRPGPEVEARAEIRDRPLFWESRRAQEAETTAPVVDVEQTEASAEEKLGKIKDVTLTGVFGSGDSAGIIYLAKGQEHRIMVGDEINGWKLQSVDSTRAVFSGKGKTAELDLKRGKIEFSTSPADGPQESADQPQKGAPPEPPAEDSLTLGGRGVPVRR